MTIPSGVQKQVIIGKQAGLGTLAAAGSGTKLRRTTATLDLRKGTLESAEIRDDQQVVDYRHGVRRVEGSLNGELSCKSYQDVWAALFRNAWATGATTSESDIDVDDTAKTFTTVAGDFVADGHKIGDLVLVSGFTEAGNNGQFVIVGLTASVMTVADPDGVLVTEAAGDAVTIATDGKKLVFPSTGHTKDYFTIEQLYEMGATDVSELAQDCVPSSFSIGVTPDGMVSVTFGIMGRDMTSDDSAYFTSPAAAANTGVLAGPNGALYKDGVAVATVTGFTLEGNVGAELGSVAFANLSPDVFLGRFRVSGSLQLYFQDNTLWESFDDEDELALVLRLDAGVDETMMITLPRIKLGSADKDDKETGGIIQTASFTALKYVGAGNYDGTTMVMQDTEAV